MGEAQKAKELAEQVDKDPSKTMYTQADMEEMSHTQAVKVLGEDRGAKANKRIIQHHFGERRGQVGTIITGSEKNFHTQEDVPCHVVKYEDGYVDYIPMNIPGFCLDKVPDKYLTKPMFGQPTRYLEMWYEDDEPTTYRTRLVKGRMVE